MVKITIVSTLNVYLATSSLQWLSSIRNDTLENEKLCGVAYYTNCVNLCLFPNKPLSSSGSQDSIPARFPADL
jgi:hypothetical protein